MHKCTAPAVPSIGAWCGTKGRPAVNARAMAKQRSSRTTWVLAVVLAIAVTAGGIALGVRYRCIILLPKGEWGFGPAYVLSAPPGAPLRIWAFEHRVELGIVAFRWR